MNNILKKVRGLPASVQLAIVGLTIFIGVALSLAPGLVGGFLFIIAGAASFLRLMIYFVEGK
jgi:hypothetical protein